MKVNEFFFWIFRVLLFMVGVEFVTINYRILEHENLLMNLNAQFLKQVCKPSLQILMEAVAAVIKLLEVHPVWVLNNSLCMFMDMLFKIN